jgi:hypothetical protein
VLKRTVGQNDVENFAVEWLAVFLRSREIPDSNSCQDTAVLKLGYRGLFQSLK